MSTPGTIRLGILGAARIAPWAAVRPAQRIPEVTIAAIAARDGERARRFAAKHAIARVYASYAALIDAPDIDAVYIPLPNSLHARWTLAALAAGKHVLCEKPLASNAAEAAAMAQAADRTGLVLAEAFHYRYHPLAQRARELILTGTIGPVEHLDIQFCTPTLQVNNIRFRYELGGGAAMDLGCYAVDMLRFLSGEEPTVVGAEAQLLRDQVDRAMDAELTLPSGATAHIFCSMLSSCLFRSRVYLRGSEGELSVANMMLPQLLYHRLTLRTAAGTRHEKFAKTPTYDYQLAAFVDAVRGHSAISADGDEGVANMRVIDAIYRAAGLQPRGQPKSCDQ